MFSQDNYHISSSSFHGNYSSLNLEIQRSHYIRPKVTVHKDAETIQGRKLFRGGNYMRKYGITYVLHRMNKTEEASQATRLSS